MIQLLLGDCLEQLKTLDDNSVDSIVTDPPYGLSFMGKSWDYDVPGMNVWAECLRVLKPGGHLLAFFGTRTYHRGVVKIEDAGFEIRDQIMWIYGSGFPKSTDVSKRIDKEAGVEREVVGENPNSRPNSHLGADSTAGSIGYKVAAYNPITAPSTPEAKQWQGWGTALKPANEPIVVARKPLEKGLTVAANVLKWGTGALNIDGSRIEAADAPDEAIYSTNAKSRHVGILNGGKVSEPEPRKTSATSQGRWPANIIFDEEAAQVLDEQSGTLKNGGGNANSKKGGGFDKQSPIANPTKFAGDSGGASRFFYVAKASKSERNAGLEGMPTKKFGMSNGAQIHGEGYDKGQGIGLNVVKEAQNFHPTVKPLKLMSYLINLVTPPNGVCLDPFMGSGSTGVAAKNLGRSFIGIERDEAYFEIAQKRIESAGPVIEEKEADPQLEFPA